MSVWQGRRKRRAVVEGEGEERRRRVVEGVEEEERRKDGRKDELIRLVSSGKLKNTRCAVR